MSVATDRLQELMSGRTGRSAEREILEILAELPAEELNQVLDAEGAGRLVDTVDNRLFGPDLHDELLDLLTRTRVDDLDVHALAHLATALQEGRTSRREEEALRDLFQSRHGEELSHLKNIVNLTQGRHDLEGLVFADIDDEQVRAAVLAHFRAEADAVSMREAKVLSDIDDTALARIHEKRYPKGAVVPGVLAFYEALDVGPHDAPRSRGDLTFVTARPSDALGLVKGESRRTLTEAGITDLSIMTGSWFNIATHDEMAAKKVENIAHYAQLFPEYDLVFVGDSGQGDIVVAQKILAAHPDVVRACFIHDVVAMPQEKRSALAREGVWVVDTYIGATLKAHELGLVSDAGLRRVIVETRTALDELEWENTEQERAARELVERDATRAEGALGG